MFLPHATALILESLTVPTHSLLGKELTPSVTSRADEPSVGVLAPP